MQSQRYRVYYIDIDKESEFDYWANELKPQIVVYNYYNADTMGWLTPGKVQRQRSRFRQASVFHEGSIDHMGFDVKLHQDPSNTDPSYRNIARPIPNYIPASFDPKIPVFGSFGFGLGGKGFTRLVEYVATEFDNAVIRLNIPYAAFGDKSGNGSRSWAESCRGMVGRNPGIYVVISHDLLPETELLDWLASNSVNCFLYDDNYGRGISGTLDYALAAGKPIAITRSWQFKHFWGVDDTCVIDGPNQLNRLLSGGTDHLQQYTQLWGDAAVLRDFEAVFDSLLGVV